jgi:hypothetical protein
MDGHTQLNDYTSIYIEWKITSTAWGWRIFLKVLEFLQDPLGGHGKSEQGIPFDQVAEREREREKRPSCWTKEDKGKEYIRMEMKWKGHWLWSFTSTIWFGYVIP